MTYRETLNELTENAAERETWEAAVTDLHQALQTVGIVLDELDERVSALESALGIEQGS
jgi:hypothetical protein